MALEANINSLSVNDLQNIFPSLTIEPNQVLEIFYKKRLLLRGIETDPLGASSRLDLSNWDWECKSLQSVQGRVNACSTLLVPDETVGTYKPFGMLFNGQTAHVFHVAAHDIASCVMQDGKMHLPQTKGTTENMTLDQLINYIITTPIAHRAYMNEVNADFHASDLLGLFINKMPKDTFISSVYQLQILYIQKFINETHAMKIPLFAYDQIKGKLEDIHVKNTDIYDLLIRAKNLLQPDLLRPVAQKLGFNISEKGRISLIA